MFKTNCSECGKEVLKKEPAKKYKTSFCSETCHLVFRKKNKQEKRNYKKRSYNKNYPYTCMQCSKTFTGYKRVQKNVFCSLSCSSKFSVKKQFKNYKDILDPQYSLKDFQYSTNGIKTKGKNKYNSVRTQAKQLYLKKDSICVRCGFTHYVEVCHIKAISSFPEDAKVAEVNAQENILLLCPRCHWELDSGFLNLVDLNKPIPLTNFVNKSHVEYKDTYCQKTLIELFQKYKGPTNRYSKIREDGKKRIKNLKLLSCQNCNYKPHVEVCHIKSIGSFPIDTLVSIINSKENLLVLCPNCHWCLDHGKLTVEEILKNGNIRS